MKPQHNPIFPYFLLLFLGFSTAFLFFLAYEKNFSSPRAILVKNEATPQEKELSLKSAKLPIPSAPSRVRVTPPLKKSPIVLKAPQFSLRQVRSGRQQVPRIYLPQLPKNKKMTRISRQAFIKVLLPLILAENECILKMRARLITVFNTLDAGRILTREDRRWLHQVAQDYRIKRINRSTLLTCVDVVPPSLALAQAILESGFGSSPAALRKNSVFGHMATLTRVAAFPSLGASVKKYVQNLNCHPAYISLRNLRTKAQQKGTSPSGYHLAQGLGKYSIRQDAYIRDVQQLIKTLNLESFDKASLCRVGASFSSSLSQN